MRICLKKSFAFPIVIMGMSGMIAQIILLRELLVTFLGNELSIGIILANWLILEAIGSFFFGKIIEHKQEKIGLFVLTTLIFSLSLPAALYLARGIKGIFGLNPGEGLGALHMLFSSFIILLPVSVTHGALFTFGCKVHSSLTGSEVPSAGKVYILEVLGTALGGIAFTYALLPFFHSFQITFGVVLLNLIVCLFIVNPLIKSRLSIKILSLLILIATGLTVYLSFSGKVEDFHWNSIKKQWGNLNVLYYENSPYGNIVVTKREEQYDFFSDGVPIITIPTPDIAFVEDFVHFPLLFHPDPEDVLVISGGAGGIIREIGKHPVKEIDYAELDPLILKTLEKFSPPSIRAEWQEPLVKIHFIDGRHYLRKTDKRYDLILIGLSNPSDLQVNRFFTMEFFTLVKKRLNKQGILLITLPGSLTYLNEELKKLNACIWRTLQEVFPFVQIIPGDYNLMIASDSPDVSSMTADRLGTRLVERELELNLITPFYITYRLQERKRKWFIDSIKDTRINLNKDYRPSGVFYSLSLWNARFSPYLSKLFNRLSELKLELFIFLALFLILLFVFIPLITAKKRIKTSIPISIITTGFSGMLFVLFIVFAFQVVYGYVYYRIGMIITAFMIGTGLGAALITFSQDRVKRGLRLFLFLEAGLIAFSILLPVIFLKIIPSWDEKEIRFSFEILFYCLSFTGGILVGAEFPLAIKIFLKESRNFSRSVGFLNASDLVGGWLGGILGGVILLPILGLGQTCIVLLMLKLTSIILLILSLQKGIED